MKKLSLLIIGGAGYIGSHMVKLLGELGHKITVLDNLSTGYKDSLLYGNLIIGDFGCGELLDEIFTTKFDAIFHFASNIQVGESVINPEKYYNNNLVKTITLLNHMKKHGVENIVFSSTAAVFGNPLSHPIDESHRKEPINPYGKSKFFVEEILDDYSRAYNLNYIALRYFNAAGASSDAIIGERHEPETHLIPLILQVASGRREFVSVFGNDYNTFDGTCIRDYIHVEDLCIAHLKAMFCLLEKKFSGCFNLGNGHGYSVLEIIEAAGKITGKKIPFVLFPRRKGDPDKLVADNNKASLFLDWNPRKSDINTIISDAWLWEQKLSKR